MTEDEIRRAVLDALRRTVPDVDTATLRGDLSVREQIDMDSIDFLRFLVAVHEAVGVEVPEADYGRLRTLDDTVAYLVGRRPPEEPPAPIAGESGG
jgi:acyl carrier protein